MSYDAQQQEGYGSFSAMQGLTPEANLARWREVNDRLTPNQDLVAHFHKTKGFDVADGPCERTWKQMMFRDDLIAEEVDELRHELGKAKPDMRKVRHEAADVLYVLYGLAVECGFDLDADFRVIHRANMTKSPQQGGKAIKGESFQEAVLDG